MKRRFQILRARVRAWPPLRVDAALGALLLAEGTAETLFADVSWGARLAAVGMTGGVAAGITLRRRAPLAAVALAVTAMLYSDVLAQPIIDNVEGPWFGLLFTVYSMAAHSEGRRLVAGALIAWVGGLAGAALNPTGVDPGDFVFLTLLLVAAPVSAGQLLRSRARLNQALRDKAERSRREAEAAASEAVEEERNRIAGELHDVIAHALGAMTVQAAAARRLAEKDPERAKGAFGAVENTGRQALGELRRLLGVLRREDEQLALEPAPRLAAVEDLARRIEAAGLPVVVRVEGAPAQPLPAGVDLTAYRVVQEALTEALTPGGAGRADVSVRYRDGVVELSVVDDGPSAAARSLLGMRERVRVYGGELSAGPRRGGGHEVRARLPLEPAA